MSAFAPTPERRATGRRSNSERRAAGRRSLLSLALAALLVAGVAAGLGQWWLDRDESNPPARPLSTGEVQRLAHMRQVNWQDGRAQVRASIGPPGQQVRVTGWVDWQHPMVYLAVSGRTPGVADGLVQAVPGLIATREAPLAAAPTTSPNPDLVDPYPAPPATPPTDGWQVRGMGSAGVAETADSPAALDALAVLLFAIADEQPASPELLAGSGSRWLRSDRAAGQEVDVLLGPAVPPALTPPGPVRPGVAAPQTSLAGMGGAVQYWLDQQARLHRFDALLASGVPVRVELDRRDQTAPRVLDALGGAPVNPRHPTEQEAQALAQLRQRNLASRGGEIRVSAVTEEGTVRAAGWLDWHFPAAYLRVSAPAASDSGLWWGDATGVATRLGPAAPTLDGASGTEVPAFPPAPPPGAIDEWSPEPWHERADEQGGYDLDLLLNEALSLAGWQSDDPGWLQEHARWLRDDELGGHPVTVYAIPRDAEQDVAPEHARLRYWVGQETGLLHRLELRTRDGTFAQLDVRGGELPGGGLAAPGS